MKLLGLECDHKVHSCHNSSFAWVHTGHRLIFLENPKACSTYVKVEIVKQNVEGIRLESREQIAEYPGFKVFGIYRDPANKMFSAFRDFTKRGDQMRLDQMRSLFNSADLSAQCVKELSFSDFLDLALVHKDHHWGPNFPYLFLPDTPVTLFKYHAGVMVEVEDFLGLEINKPPRASSPSYDHVITSEEKDKIRRIMIMDYENMDYFRERLINV